VVAAPFVCIASIGCANAAICGSCPLTATRCDLADHAYSAQTETAGDVADPVGEAKSRGIVVVT
jgi:hypothetical protein